MKRMPLELDVTGAVERTRSMSSGERSRCYCKRDGAASSFDLRMVVEIG